MIKGCDVSHHQRQINFDQLRPAVEFAVIKATEGVGYKDPKFSYNWSESHRVGLVRMAYHFARPDLGNSPQAEANWLLDVVGELLPGDGLVLDYEKSLANPVPWCLGFLKQLEARAGFRPLIYLNLATTNSKDWSSVVAGNYGLWLAQYPDNANPDRSLSLGHGKVRYWPFVAMWQYSSMGRLPGIAGNVDLNVFYGSRDQLLKYCKPAPAAVQPSIPAPVVVHEEPVVAQPTPEPFTVKGDTTEPTLPDPSPLAVQEDKVPDHATEIPVPSNPKESEVKTPVSIPEKLTSRKFWMAVVGLMTALSSFLAGQIDAVALVTSVTTIVLGYLAAEGYVDGKRAGVEPAQ